MALHYNYSECNPVPYVALKAETQETLWNELTPEAGWVLSSDGTQKLKAGFNFCEQLCWLTISIGLCEITQKNVTEWHRRILHLHGYNKKNAATNGGIYRSRWLKNGFNHAEVINGDESALITLEELKTCIGLSTNAATMTKAQFARKYRY